MTLDLDTDVFGDSVEDFDVWDDDIISTKGDDDNTIRTDTTEGMSSLEHSFSQGSDSPGKPLRRGRKPSEQMKTSSFSGRRQSQTKTSPKTGQVHVKHVPPQAPETSPMTDTSRSPGKRLLHKKILSHGGKNRSRSPPLVRRHSSRKQSSRRRLIEANGGNAGDVTDITSPTKNESRTVQGKSGVVSKSIVRTPTKRRSVRKSLEAGAPRPEIDDSEKAEKYELRRRRSSRTVTTAQKEDGHSPHRRRSSLNRKAAPQRHPAALDLGASVSTIGSASSSSRRSQRAPQRRASLNARPPSTRKSRHDGSSSSFDFIPSPRKSRSTVPRRSSSMKRSDVAAPAAGTHPPSNSHSSQTRAPPRRIGRNASLVNHSGGGRGMEEDNSSRRSGLSRSSSLRMAVRPQSLQPSNSHPQEHMAASRPAPRMRGLQRAASFQLVTGVEGL